MRDGVPPDPRPVMASPLIRRDIISLARLVGCPVLTQAGKKAGRVADVAARVRGGDAYPAVRAGHRRAFLDATAIDRAGPRAVRLRAARIEWDGSGCRAGEVLLARDILDRQLVHTGEAKVIRAADLYFAAAGEELRLVGVAADLRTLLLRLGPRRCRGRPIGDEIIDWAVIERFSPGPGPDAGRPRTPHAGLRKLRLAELAHVLEALGGHERQELLASLGYEIAAAALEQMQDDDVTALLRAADPAWAAQLLAAMEPGEALRALRRLPPCDRPGLLDRMPRQAQVELGSLLAYPGNQAGGVMSTLLACVHPSETVEQARRGLGRQGGYRTGTGSVAVLDESGQVAGDVPVFDLLLSDGTRRVADLIDPGNPPVTLHPDAPLGTVTATLMDSRRSSLLVVDGAGHPLGRIRPEDVLDALVPGNWRPRCPHLPR
jgi:CBS domain-containing protein